MTMMKKSVSALSYAVCISLAFCTITVSAQSPSTDNKTEWASRVVALQQGPELDRLVTQLAGSSTQELIATWGPKLEANVPKARQQKASDDLNAELKKYADDAAKVIAKHVGKVSADALVPSYAERFTLEELKQIAGFFESPAIKKYQALAPELGNTFVQKLVDASRVEVLARARQFDDAALKIVGSGPPAAVNPVAPSKKP